MIQQGREYEETVDGFNDLRGDDEERLANAEEVSLCAW